MDTAIPRKERPNKILVKTKGRSRYYKRGGYVCDFCPYSSNKTCALCVFAVWNVHGIKAGFSPVEADRRAHKDEISSSPLMQKLKRTTPLEHGQPHNQVLPKVRLPMFPVKSYNSLLNSAVRIQEVREKL